MANLYFRYGAMGSSKTANLLMVQYNYKEKGKNAVIIKPQIDNRDGVDVVKSRIGLSAKSISAESFLNDIEKNINGVDAILVDECQFLAATQVDALAEIADKYDITVICYGLKTDFKGQLFEGSKRLVELADKIEEIPTICWCGKKAKFNARYSGDKIIKTGNQIELGANDRYVALCRKHYMEGKLHN